MAKINMDSYYLGMLQGYFTNIIAACNNEERDERPYIRGVAEIGFDVIKEILTKEK